MSLVQNPVPHLLPVAFLFLFLLKVAFSHMYNSWSEGLSSSEQTLSFTRPSLLNNRQTSAFPKQKESRLREMNVKECQLTPLWLFKVSFWEESGFLLKRSWRPACVLLKNLCVVQSRRRCRSAAFQRSRRHSEVSALWPLTSPQWLRAGRVMNAASFAVPHESGGVKKRVQVEDLRQDLMTVPPLETLSLSCPSPAQLLRRLLLEVHDGEPSGQQVHTVLRGKACGWLAYFFFCKAWTIFLIC